MTTMASTTTTVQRSCQPPIASLGFWADKAVPLSCGVRQAARDKAQVPPAPMSASAVELQAQCCQARAHAEVGGDIRWDVIIEQAALLPCGLRMPAAAPSRAPAAKLGKLGEDDESTSAGSGSCSEGAAGPGSASDSESDAASQSGPAAPWGGTARRYSAAALLQTLSLLRLAGELGSRPPGLPKSAPEQVLRAARTAPAPGLQPDEAAASPCAKPQKSMLVGPPPGLPAPVAKPSATPRAAVAAAPWRRQRPAVATKDSGH